MSKGRYYSKKRNTYNHRLWMRYEGFTLKPHERLKCLKYLLDEEEQPNRTKVSIQAQTMFDVGSPR